MPKLRKLADLAQFMLAQRMKQRQADYENDLITERQRGLAEYQHGLGLKADDAATQNRLLIDASTNPEVAERLARLHPEFGKLGRTGAQMNVPIAKDIADAKNEFELGTAADVIGQRASMVDQTGVMGPEGTPLGRINSLADINPLLEQRSAKATDFGIQREGEMDRAGQTSFLQSLNQGRGTEQATAESFDANLARGLRTGQQNNQLEFAKQRGLNPIMADRSAMTTTAGLRAGAEFAQNDPQLIAVADQVLSNPDLLGELTPTDRFKVLAVMNGKGFENKRKVTQEKMISEAEAALDDLKGSPSQGIAGAFGVPSPFSPGSITRWWDDKAMSGSSAGDVQAKVEQLTSRLTMPRLEMMKGMGQLSDGDMRVLQAGATKLGRVPPISDAEAYREMAIIEKVLAEARRKAGLPPRVPAGADGGTPTPGAAPRTPPPSVQSILGR